MNEEKSLFTPSSKSIAIAVGLIVVLAVLIGSTGASRQFTHMLSMQGNMEHIGEDVEHMIGKLVAEGEYKCCLEKPCTYCLLDEGMCECLNEVINGEGPCGECIGEILEGEGNKFLAPYFALALADKIGKEYISELKVIISEHYGISIEEQWSR